MLQKRHCFSLDPYRVFEDNFLFLMDTYQKKERLWTGRKWELDNKPGKRRYPDWPVYSD